MKEKAKKEKQQKKKGKKEEKEERRKGRGIYYRVRGNIYTLKRFVGRRKLNEGDIFSKQQG